MKEVDFSKVKLPTSKAGLHWAGYAMLAGTTLFAIYGVSKWGYNQLKSKAPVGGEWSRVI